MSKIKKFIEKKNKSKIVSLTAYSKNITSILDNYCDLILVGDSLGSVLYNYKSTREVTLNTMIRIKDVDESLKFFCEGLGLKETRRMENEKGRFTLIFLAAPGDENAEIELTYNWDGDELGEGSRNFGHLAYRVENIYETCKRLMDMGYTINRPPRDGHMAFVRSPDKISIEILQKGNLEPKEPWVSMENTGTW